MLRVEEAVVRFGDRAVLSGVSLDVGPGETVAVLGPSGCGKSTLLRCVAGLEPLAGGRVEWEGEDLARVPPHARGFGLMFQDYALFPHRDVRGNVEFGLRMVGAGAAERARRVDEVLTLVGLAGFGSRRVAQLSGGEQQRVALARSLAPSPRLLMLDEPLGSLDRALHDRLLGELHNLLEEAALPTLYVTHDQDEAFSLADRVVVLRNGTVAQVGPPRDVWCRPADEWIAAFLGFPPAVDAMIDGDAARTPWGVLDISHDTPRMFPETASHALREAGPARVVLRPGGLRIDAGGTLTGRVEQLKFRGERTVACVKLGAGPELEATVEAADGEPAPPGTTVRVAIDPAAILVYPPVASGRGS